MKSQQQITVYPVSKMSFSKAKFNIPEASHLPAGTGSLVLGIAALRDVIVHMPSGMFYKMNSTLIITECSFFLFVINLEDKVYFV